MRVVGPLLLVCACLLLVAPPVGAAPVGTGPGLEPDLVYSSPEGWPLAMDLARPASSPAGGSPAILLVHGGGFHSGSRDRMAPYLRRFTAAGYVTATIDYRLRPRADVQRLGLEAASSLAQEDAEAAVRYLRTNAARYAIDPKRIVILGASAGAITALNVAARATGRSRVQAAVSIAGFGPISSLDAGDPPLLLLHGTADRAAPIDRARATCRAASAVGERCRLVEAPGLGHHALIRRHARISRTVLGWLRKREIGTAPLR